MTESNQVSDFFSHFIEQSKVVDVPIEQQAVGYPTLPKSVNVDYEEYYKPSAPLSSPAPPPLLAAPSNSSSGYSEPTQVYSFVSGSGDPPPGYRVSESCANCEYFCGGSSNGYCAKYDFPCASNYMCDSYERAPLILMESGAYALEYSFSAASAQSLTLLSDALQNGMAKALTEKGIDLSSTRDKLYIFDQQSAQVALAFAEQLTKEYDRPILIKAASKYAPDFTQQYLARINSVPTPPEKQPADLVLYKFAMVTSDKEHVQSVYEQLYKQKYGEEKALYTEPEPAIDLPLYPDAPESEQQNLSDMPGATVTEPTYVGDVDPGTTEAVLDDRLRAIAEKRVSYLASKSNTTFTQDDVQKMLDDIKQTRQKLDIG